MVTQNEPVSVTCGGGVLHEPQAVLAAALEAYVAIDAAGRVVAWNPAAETTFGYPREQACGQPVCELIVPPRYRLAHQAGLKRIAAGRPGRVLGQRLHLSALHADGHEFPIEMTLTLTRQPDGPVFHAFAHDVTVARRASRFRDVEAAVTDDLLDLARLESGHLAIQPTATRLCTVIGDAVAAHHRQATDKHITVTITAAGDADLHADPDRLRQVADNLLSNAIKYTPAGGTITITVTADDDWICWSVADTGIGIPEAERPRLFRRFYRASTALDRHIPGTGLGLVITRAIIERHHGTITLAEHTGPGTTFLIQLPTKPPPATT